MKRIIGQNDARLKKNQEKGEVGGKKVEKGAEVVREVPQVSSSLFFQHNMALGTLSISLYLFILVLVVRRRESEIYLSSFRPAVSASQDEPQL